MISAFDRITKSREPSWASNLWSKGPSRSKDLTGGVRNSKVQRYGVKTLFEGKGPRKGLLGIRFRILNYFQVDDY
jgi:hypothetical protein